MCGCISVSVSVLYAVLSGGPDQSDGSPLFQKWQWCRQCQPLSADPCPGGELGPQLHGEACPTATQWHQEGTPLQVALQKRNVCSLPDSREWEEPPIDWSR